MIFKKDKDKDDIIKIAALLIHAAKIDQDFSNKEENIIKLTLLKIGANDEDIQSIIDEGKIIEENSNQILDFTKKVKSMENDNKIRIIEALWQIIYSDKKADIYEANLMRRLAGLLYIDNKTMGDIKDKIEKENS